MTEFLRRLSAVISSSIAAAASLKRAGLRCVGGALVATVLTALPTTAQATDHQWTHFVFDAFTLNGQEVWTAEDGGRIRHRSAAGVWTFQTTPEEVVDTLKRIFFLTDGLHGWAVGQNGWLISTADGGANWITEWQAPPIVAGDSHDDLWDVFFFDTEEGWILGEHAIWYRPNTATPWGLVTLDTGSFNLADVELYAFDIISTSGGGIVGLASAEPGLIFRATTPDHWSIQFDLRQLCPVAPETCATQTTGTPGTPAWPLSPCACTTICAAALTTEPWDIKISRHPTDKLALCVGGVGSDCGYSLASADDGLTWVVEPHECRCPIGYSAACLTGCLSNPLYNDQGPTSTWRQRRFFELYGVAIFDIDNTAIASGYSGQHLVREDVDPNPLVNKGLWRDRSSYTDHRFTAPLHAVSLPGYGVATNSDSITSGIKIGYWTGMGGYVRRLVDGGQTWGLSPNYLPEQQGDQWRIRDVHFINADEGWMATQFHLIARTIDAGESWTLDASGYALSAPFLNAITLSGSGPVGVAVGENDSGEKHPKILVNSSIQTNNQWLTPTDIASGHDPDSVESMHEVTWAGDQEFWTVGSSGLIYHSDPTSGPAVAWSQFVPPGEDYEDFKDFLIQGVSFAGVNSGVFVGQRPAGTAVVGKAYHYRKVNSTVQWNEIEIQNEPDLAILSDVVIAGATAYAVGELKDVSTLRTGIILSSSLNGGGDFATFTRLQVFDQCTVGEGLGDVPVLSQVELAPGGAIWIGGECGRLWRSTNGTTWSSVRSMTDAHVRGMSFPDPDTGFVAGHRPGHTGHCIVRVTTPP